jgi:hypothetical protein
MIGTRHKQEMFPYRSQIWAAAESRNQENHREMDIRLIDFERLEVYEAEAVLLIMLAYPTRAKRYAAKCTPPFACMRSG